MAPAAKLVGGSATPHTCHPQYRVTAPTNARSAPAGPVLGSVAAGTKVNLRDLRGAWGYGYIASINGGPGGFGWLMLEKLDPLGTVCPA